MLSRFSLLIFVLSLSPSLHAEFKSADEAVAKLKSYKEEELKHSAGQEAKTEAKVDAREDQFFDDLDEAVKFATSRQVNHDFLISIAEATAMSLRTDDTGYAGEIVLPLFQKDKKAFRDALKKLPKKDSERVEESLQEKEHESKTGNG